MNSELSYIELSRINTFRDRFLYLQQNAVVAESTFGFERYLNQEFYKSKEWQRVRDQVIVRDSGCDLGCLDYPIKGPIYIHHINPITPEDIVNHSDKLTDLNNLICVSRDTHNAIHYGNAEITNKYEFTERTSNDVCPWKNKGG